ncbi:MAG: aldo/keto reductase [Synergistaceae bacterium]|jgi:aryl-alcohol dehydrogenase-like predicted oxidoreductase|nr:aldo/keto reductase [Synergistaceae bacterium]
MKYRKFGNSGIDVSVIGLGTWPLGSDFFGAVEERKGIDTIHKALDLGVNLIDTSPAYGQAYEAEITVGKALKGRRDKAVLSTKFGVHRVLGVGDYKIPGEYTRCLSPAVAEAELENSLKRLGSDYIDIYFIHWPDLNFGNDGALELLAKWKKEGKIRAGAVSNFSVEQTKHAVEKAGISGIQPSASIFDRSNFDNGVIPFARDAGLGIMTYGSLGGGILTGAFKEPPKVTDKELRVFFYDFFGEEKWAKCGKVIDTLREIAGARGVSTAEVSINWVLARPGVSTALIGTTKPENMEKNARAADWELSAEELKKIDDSYAANMI